MALFSTLTAPGPQGDMLRQGLLGLGAGLLSGSQGSYGAFAPALGAGVAGMSMGMENAAKMGFMQQKADESRQKMEYQQALREMQMNAAKRIRAMHSGGEGLGLGDYESLMMMGVPGAKEAFDAYKFGAQGIKREEGATYIDPNTGQERRMPKLGEGMDVSNGVVQPMPGYVDTVGALEGARAHGSAAGALTGERAGLQATGDLDRVMAEKYAPLVKEATTKITSGESTIASVDRNIGYIDRLLNNKDGLQGIMGQLGQYRPTMAMTDKQLEARADLNAVKSKVVLNTMAEMRAASASGATGFGNMNREQLKVIEDSLGSLERAQTYDQVVMNLKIIRDAMEGIKNSAQAEIDSTRQIYQDIPGIPQGRLRGEQSELTASPQRPTLEEIFGR